MTQTEFYPTTPNEEQTDLLENYDALFSRWAESPTPIMRKLSTSLPTTAQPLDAFFPLSDELQGFWFNVYQQLSQKLVQHQPIPSPRDLERWTCFLTHHEWADLSDEKFCIWCEDDAGLQTLNPQAETLLTVLSTDEGWTATWQHRDHTATTQGEADGTSLRHVLQGLVTLLTGWPEDQPLTVVLPSQAIWKPLQHGWLTRWARDNWQTQGHKPVMHADLWAQLITLPSTITWLWEPLSSPVLTALQESNA